jgi:hypothetical protein
MAPWSVSIARMKISICSSVTALSAAGDNSARAAA